MRTVAQKRLRRLKNNLLQYIVSGAHGMLCAVNHLKHNLQLGVPMVNKSNLAQPCFTRFTHVRSNQMLFVVTR